MLKKVHKKPCRALKGNAEMIFLVFFLFCFIKALIAGYIVKAICYGMCVNDSLILFFCIQRDFLLSAPSCHKEIPAYLFKLQAAYNVALAMLC